jgi:GDPmannose 4,6-dehydratase
MAFDHVGLNWQDHVKFDENYLRPTEVDSLIGDASLAESKLNWRPTVHPQELVKIMVDHDILQLNGHVVDKPKLDDWA